MGEGKLVYQEQQFLDAFGYAVRGLPSSRWDDLLVGFHDILNGKASIELRSRLGRDMRSASNTKNVSGVALQNFSKLCGIDIEGGGTEDGGDEDEEGAELNANPKDDANSNSDAAGKAGTGFFSSISGLVASMSGARSKSTPTHPVKREAKRAQRESAREQEAERKRKAKAARTAQRKAAAAAAADAARVEYSGKMEVVMSKITERTTTAAAPAPAPASDDPPPVTSTEMEVYKLPVYQSFVSKQIIGLFINNRSSNAELFHETILVVKKFINHHRTALLVEPRRKLTLSVPREALVAMPQDWPARKGDPRVQKAISGILQGFGLHGFSSVAPALKPPNLKRHSPSETTWINPLEFDPACQMSQVLYDLEGCDHSTGIGKNSLAKNAPYGAQLMGNRFLASCNLKSTLQQDRLQYPALGGGKTAKGTPFGRIAGIAIHHLSQAEIAAIIEENKEASG